MRQYRRLPGTATQFTSLGCRRSTRLRGDVVDAPIERQTEIVLEQMKLCLETAGSSLENVLKCNVYCTSVDKYAAVNAVYARYFSTNPPARVFVNVPAWPGHFDIEIDCIAAVEASQKARRSN